MKTLLLRLTTTLTSIVAVSKSVHPVSASLTIKSSDQIWPEVKVYPNFSANASIYTWNGQVLSPLQNTITNILVDSQRDKAMFHS